MRNETSAESCRRGAARDFKRLRGTDVNLSAKGCGGDRLPKEKVSKFAGAMGSPKNVCTLPHSYASLPSIPRSLMPTLLDIANIFFLKH